VERVLPELAELGFDVVYLPPIHPIGRRTARAEQHARRAKPATSAARGRSARRRAGTRRSIPTSGRVEEFEHLVAAAREAGIEIALDYAIQCSPDHPWLEEHPSVPSPPDGTLKYAENPPKKYQDIYNVNFESEDRQGCGRRCAT
jgi:starch synthase (maltosyl-transferring)